MFAYYNTEELYMVSFEGKVWNNWDGLESNLVSTLKCDLNHLNIFWKIVAESVIYGTDPNIIEFAGESAVMCDNVKWKNSEKLGKSLLKLRMKTGTTIEPWGTPQ